MVYLFFALYVEAKPFLEKWNVKKQNQYTKYQVFERRNICCMIMGVGPMKTAIHLSHFLSSRDLNKEDIFINIGFAGAKGKKKKIGELYFIHKIHAHDSGRDFYPEVLYKQNCLESALESFSKVVSDKTENIQEDLVDMEGAAFFETLSFFVKKRQIFLYKCVSDFLEGEKRSKTIFLERHVDALSAFFVSFFKKKEVLEETREKLCSQLAEHFFCSASMEVQLQELLRYASSKGMNLENLLEKYWKKEIRSKSEGKKYVEELRRNILEF